jgi:hypothetical protein
MDANVLDERKGKMEYSVLRAPKTLEDIKVRNFAEKSKHLCMRSGKCKVTETAEMV